jgi:hypothetical protein
MMIVVKARYAKLCTEKGRGLMNALFASEVCDMRGGGAVWHMRGLVLCTLLNVGGDVCRDGGLVKPVAVLVS